MNEPSVKQGTAMILFKREYDSAGVLRRLQFKLDGTTVAQLRPHQERRLDVPAGVYVLQVKMDWATSEPMQISLAPGSTLRVTGAIDFSMIIKVFTQPRTALGLAVSYQP